MDLILNNLKGLGIHLLMSIFSMILVSLCVFLSPLSGSQIIATIVVVLIYIFYILAYLKLSHYLKVESSKSNDYLVGILAFIIGISLWGLSIYYSGCSISYIPESEAIYWMPYNTYIFASWPFIYGQKNPLILILGNLSPFVLLTVGIKIRRYTYTLNK